MIKTMEVQDSLGGLQVGVFNISIAKPVSHANVQIFNYNEDGARNLIYAIETDIDGQTEIIYLSAPPIEYSLSPDMPKPFSEYNVEITADGFESVLVNNVQIFSGQIAIQHIDLTPLVASNENNEVIDILPPTLWGDYPSKIPEEEVKALPDESGFVVLDEVIIPEYIVVHDGTPNDNSAPDYYIPFKDYIKNVASSEIYSTWPDAAIRANVLAIISFTLNRVYTEWYRGKGKSFTITSSTAYDHFFVYGRNIFEEINIIVDEMFTTYIKRPGSRQPLFAQYCDGVRVSCPNWLSQWGCVDLAESGYSAIDILKYYYGNDIYLENASSVSGVPQSYPGTPLRLGSSGNDVRTIQNQLNRIADNYPTINKIRADGVFGENTEEAVIRFQQIFNLTTDGVVGFSTWYAISNIYVAVTKMAELT